MDPPSSTADLGQKISDGLQAITSRNGLAPTRSAYLQQKPPPESTPAPSRHDLQQLATTADHLDTYAETSDQEYHISL
ncbi:hypothetical protein PHMEG_0006335 [Phytophthora megakarya]|uniref:Uncharacterized protein n=1 Tax=Phytophthora megakarya TaxID=4795 RepID=A0A225WPD5_9STRA|nr:hypothetical protein PHMEG_0006335 [Phytophthora megakarya]